MKQCTIYDEGDDELYVSVNVFSITILTVDTPMPCLHETRLREVNVISQQRNVTQYNRNVNLPRVNVSRINTA